jgi:hypothetical protein
VLETGRLFLKEVEPMKEAFIKSGLPPTFVEELRQAVATFPDAASVQYLRETGVSAVLLLRSQVAGTPWERSGDIPVDALGIRRQDLDDDTVLFRLS